MDRMRAQVYENIKDAPGVHKQWNCPGWMPTVPDGTYLMWIGYGTHRFIREDMRRLLEEKGHLIPLMGTHFEGGRQRLVQG